LPQEVFVRREEHTEVLVVGAGPVGMLTALLLAEADLDVMVIDKEWRTAAHSYACVLHPGTLRLLDRLGLAQEVMEQGRRIETVAFYEGESRRAEMKLSQLQGDFPCAVVLPQSTFEDLLEQRLSQRNGIKVHWNHRLSDLAFENGQVLASIDKLKQTAKGYIVAEWDWTVQRSFQTRAAYVVGADGHHSMVRARLGIDYERLADPEIFAVFESETDSDPGTEVRIVMDAATTNVLWPLPGNHCRWSFQLVKAKDAGEFPEKEREYVRVVQEKIDKSTRSYLEKLVQKRAPWFKHKVNDVYWWVRIGFEHRLTRQFGKGRCWLAGDAAHQTGPVGAQSMNAGLSEAEDLAGKLKQILDGGSSLELLDLYNRVHRSQWDKLLGLGGGLGAKSSADPWVKDHRERILPCIPALGEDLTHLTNQVGLEF
jgi:2-polyprenyl-6-methoxyphenol hydroxylase-like FAD-dependent oxidoreductase